MVRVCLSYPGRSFDRIGSHQSNTRVVLQLRGCVPVLVREAVIVARMGLSFVEKIWCSARLQTVNHIFADTGMHPIATRPSEPSVYRMIGLTSHARI